MKFTGSRAQWSFGSGGFVEEQLFLAYIDGAS
jgi:hypothetical protein